MSRKPLAFILGGLVLIAAIYDSITFPATSESSQLRVNWQVFQSPQTGKCYEFADYFTQTRHADHVPSGMAEVPCSSYNGDMSQQPVNWQVFQSPQTGKCYEFADYFTQTRHADHVPSGMAEVSCSDVDEFAIGNT